MKTRQVANSSTLINAHMSPPPNGSRVMALNRTGVLIHTIWTSKSIQTLDAWSAYPSVPEDVRELQSSRYKF